MSLRSLQLLVLVVGVSARSFEPYGDDHSYIPQLSDADDSSSDALIGIGKELPALSELHQDSNTQSAPESGSGPGIPPQGNLLNERTQEPGDTPFLVPLWSDVGDVPYGVDVDSHSALPIQSLLPTKRFDALLDSGEVSRDIADKPDKLDRPDLGDFRDSGGDSRLHLMSFRDSHKLIKPPPLKRTVNEKAEKQGKGTKTRDKSDHGGLLHIIREPPLKRFEDLQPEWEPDLSPEKPEWEPDLNPEKPEWEPDLSPEKPEWEPEKLVRPEMRGQASGEEKRDIGMTIKEMMLPKKVIQPPPL